MPRRLLIAAIVILSLLDGYIDPIEVEMVRSLLRGMTTEKEFMKRIVDKRIKSIALLDGSLDMDAGDCQFEVEMEDGYSFVASGNEVNILIRNQLQERIIRPHLHRQEER